MVILHLAPRLLLRCFAPLGALAFLVWIAPQLPEPVGSGITSALHLLADAAWPAR